MSSPANWVDATQQQQKLIVIMLMLDFVVRPFYDLAYISELIQEVRGRLAETISVVIDSNLLPHKLMVMSWAALSVRPRSSYFR